MIKTKTEAQRCVNAIADYLKQKDESPRAAADLLDAFQFAKMPQMRFSEGSYFFTDYYNTIWRLRPTANRSMPFIIDLVERQ